MNTKTELEIADEIMTEILVDEIVIELLRVAKNGLSGHDIGGITADATYKLNQGWTKAEVLSYCKNSEEVNPDLDEDIAISNMNRICTEVEARLGTKDLTIVAN